MDGPRALRRLRGAEVTLVLPWPASGTAVTLAEALPLVVLEATVHLAPAVELIEAATGRSTPSPLPVLR